MTPYPIAMQMRYLQALADVASDQNSTIIFPLPLELMKPFLRSGRNGTHPSGLAKGQAEVVSPGENAPAQPEQIDGATPTAPGGKGR
jgi:hypothetical protein